MHIGIDIDDTITDSWECLIPHYSKLFGIPEEVLHTRPPYSRSLDKPIDLDEYFDMVLPILDEVIPKVHLQPKVKETIDKLYELGCKVYFLTARGKGHTDAYKDSKEYLDKHHIKYEQIITNCGNKAEKCKALNIELFIDDSYHHCQEALDNGIDVLMPLRYYNEHYQEFKHFDNWEYVYDYVKGRWFNGQ